LNGQFDLAFGNLNPLLSEWENPIGGTLLAL